MTAPSRIDTGRSAGSPDPEDESPRPGFGPTRLAALGPDGRVECSGSGVLPSSCRSACGGLRQHIAYRRQHADQQPGLAPREGPD
jgi:hypothetical protein